MRARYSDIARDVNGVIISSATVSVYMAGTTTAANVYTSVTSTTAVNSVTTDADGSYTFYVDQLEYGSYQKYKITVSKTSFDPFTLDYIEIDDVVTGTYTISTAKTVSYPVYIPYGVLFAKSGSGSIAFNADTEIGKYQVFDSTFTSGITFRYGPVYPEWWGAVADNSTDCTTAIQSSVDSNRMVCFTGKYKTGKITLLAGTHDGQKFIGKDRYISSITNNSANDLFYQSGGFLEGVTFRELSINSSATSGDIFSNIFGSFGGIKDCNIVQSNPAKSIIKQNTSGPAQTEFSGGRWSANAGARSAKAIDISIPDINGDGGENFFNIIFDNIMMDASATDTVTFMFFYNFRAAGAAASWGPILRNLTMEVMGGGGIEFQGCFQPTLDTIVFDDLGVTPANPLIKITNAAGGQDTKSPVIKNCYAKSGHGSNSNPDVYINAFQARIIGCIFGYTSFPNSATYALYRPLVSEEYASFSNLVGTSTYTALNPGAVDDLLFDLNPVSDVFKINTGGIIFGNNIPTVASNTTISVTKPVTFVSGTTNIEAVGLNTSFTNWSATIGLVPTGAWTMTATAGAGHIAKAVTAVVGQTLWLTYDTVTQLWYPSY